MPAVSAVTGNGAPAATSQTPRTMGKDEFLRLLVTQLKQQDPLSPVQNTEFVAQMAQLTSLEQLQDLNKGLSQLIELQQQQGVKQDLLLAAGLLGREIEARDPVTGASYREVVQGYHLKDGEIWLECRERELPLGWVVGSHIEQGGAP